MMKKIEEIIKKLKMDEVKEEIKEVGLKGINVIEEKGLGRKKGNKEI